ncbi:mask [Symbiodinium sp. KB8]|nr:mask [Symbiodinium sp. KB8]
MLRLTWMTSGEEVASIGVEELSDAKALKQELSRKHGLPPRFRQRLFHRGSPVDDSAPLDSILELQLVVLPYSLAPMEAEELATASVNGTVSEVEAILQQPRHPDMVCDDGRSPAMLASAEGHVEVVGLLLEAGADKNLAAEDGYTALMSASRKGHVEVARLLLEAGADQNSAGADKNSADEDGYTALMSAALNGNDKVVRMLLEAGADRNAATESGSTALMMASAEGEVEVVGLLLEAGADKNLADADGSTALTQASDNGHVEVVERIDMSKVDGEELTQAELAPIAHNAELCAPLRFYASYAAGTVVSEHYGNAMPGVDTGLGTEKYIFLVRHAQSTWNREVDHVKTLRHRKFPELSVKAVVCGARHGKALQYLSPEPQAIQFELEFMIGFGACGVLQRGVLYVRSANSLVV